MPSSGSQATCEWMLQTSHGDLHLADCQLPRTSLGVPRKSAARVHKFAIVVLALPWQVTAARRTRVRNLPPLLQTPPVEGVLARGDRSDIVAVEALHAHGTLLLAEWRRGVPLGRHPRQGRRHPGHGQLPAQGCDLHGGRRQCGHRGRLVADEREHPGRHRDLAQQAAAESHRRTCGAPLVDALVDHREALQPAGRRVLHPRQPAGRCAEPNVPVLPQRLLQLLRAVDGELRLPEGAQARGEDVHAGPAEAKRRGEVLADDDQRRRHASPDGLAGGLYAWCA
mmetsp:Transcript_11376/g.30356  ORF Transcript_11376/g.30356 Transcript_11376/m.30356 type:complete len:282 (+) Transcript_11376:513-1358(+)